MIKQDFSILELELRKIGLSEKEARVYLLCLESGRTSVQNIAQKSELSRPTVYRILEALRRKDLIEKFSRSSKSIAAKSPDEILGMLRAEKRKLEEKEREFIRIISLLKNRYLDGKNEIKFYAGKEGGKFLLDDFATTPEQNIFTVFSSASCSEKNDLEDIYRSIKKRLGKIEVREIFPEKTGESDLPFVKRKTAPGLALSGTLVACDKIIYLHKDKNFSIEEESAVKLVRLLLEALWQN
jgi:sugar-specific transcriptional regulator TrmB